MMIANLFLAIEFDIICCHSSETLTDIRLFFSYVCHLKTFVSQLPPTFCTAAVCFTSHVNVIPPRGLVA